MPMIKLESSDGVVFQVDLGIAQQIAVLSLDRADEIMDEEVVPLPNVNAAILEKVIQWATHHMDDPPLPEDDAKKERRTNDISPWDGDFLSRVG